MCLLWAFSLTEQQFANIAELCCEYRSGDELLALKKYLALASHERRVAQFLKDAGLIGTLWRDGSLFFTPPLDVGLPAFLVRDRKAIAGSRFILKQVNL